MLTVNDACDWVRRPLDPKHFETQKSYNLCGFSLPLGVFFVLNSIQYCNDPDMIFVGHII